MFYELWELDAGNRIGEYATETAALRDVLAAIRRDGAARIASLALCACADDPSGESRFIAEGDALAALALATVPNVLARLPA